MGRYAPNFTDEQVAEVHASRRESITLETRTASVEVEVPWAIRYAVMNDIMLGQQPYPEDSFLLPVSISSQPDQAETFTDGQQVQSIHTARLQINYSPPGQNGAPDDPITLVSESIEPSAEFITQDFRSFVWLESDNSTKLRPILPAEAPGQLITGLTLVRTLYQRPSIPASYLTLPGKCNDAAYTSAILNGLRFEEETLLFKPGQASRTLTTAGTEGFTLTVPMQFKPEGWNKTYLPDEERWAFMGRVNKDGDTNGIYRNHPRDDFRDWLF